MLQQASLSESNRNTNSIQQNLIETSDLLGRIEELNWYIDIFKNYIKVINIILNEFTTLDFEILSAFKHELNNKLYVKGYLELLQLDKEWNNYGKLIWIINDYISYVIPEFFSKYVKILLEKKRKNSLIEIWNILWYDFLNINSLTKIDDFIHSFQKFHELLWYKVDNRWSTLIVENDWKKCFDIVISCNDFNFELKQEFFLILENLLWNSIKAYDKIQDKSKKEHKIECNIVIVWNEINFSVKDNFCWLNCEQLFTRFYNNPGCIPNEISTLVHNLIIRDWEISPEEIFSMYFTSWVSTFWTWWKWLAICERLLKKNGWTISVENGNWYVKFYWKYLIN